MTCPICGKPTVEKYRPFCSRRCADIDLGKWISGDYAIATDEAPDGDVSPDSDAAQESRLH